MPQTTKIDFQKLLNPQQLEAVTHGEGPQLVLAGAGSGKTRVITYRIAWLVQEKGIDPSEITAVTFTNKAAGEMKERVEDLVAMRPLPSFVGTFHRCALRLLRIYGERIGLDRSFAIFDSTDQLGLIKKALKKEGLDEKAFRPRAVLASISGAKNKLAGPRQFENEAEDFFRRKIAPVYHHYQKALRKAKAVDFDDMIRFAVKILEDEELRRRIRRRSRFLLVDEFQDTNLAQLRLVQHLCGAGGNLTAVGDEDQGIYRWRGAELENILNFESTFKDAEIRKLERNYRSTQNILDAAGAVVANNEGRRGKKLWTKAGSGEKVVLYQGNDERDEARWAANLFRSLEDEFRLSEMAILVRTNAQTRSFEDVFLRQGIPYLLVGAIRFYERAEIKDLVAYLRFLRNPGDDTSLSRIVNQPPRGIGKTTQDKLEASASQAGRSLWETLDGGDLSSLPARSVLALRRFRDAMAPLIAEAQELPLPSLLERLLEATNYTSLFDEHDEEGRAKLENVGEFLSAAQEFAESHSFSDSSDDPLTAFLDHISLVSDTDVLGNRGGVPIMTLHSAKGLEFKAVIVAGLEEKLLPHMNAFQPEAVEEERRLLYVGMTRARRRLFLTTCRRRMVAGTFQDQEESRFLAEIPPQYFELEQSSQLFYDSRRPRGSRGRGRPQGRGQGRGSRTGQSTSQDVYSFFGGSSGDSRSSQGAQQSLPGFSQPAARAERRPTAPKLPFMDEPAEKSPPAGKSAGASSFRKGTWVHHAKLGRGRILSIEGSGDDQRLIVYFQGQGRRKLVAKYANLEVC